MVTLTRLDGKRTDACMMSIPWQVGKSQHRTQSAVISMLADSYLHAAVAERQHPEWNQSCWLLHRFAVETHGSVIFLCGQVT